MENIEITRYILGHALMRDLVGEEELVALIASSIDSLVDDMTEDEVFDTYMELRDRLGDPVDLKYLVRSRRMAEYGEEY